MTVNTNLGAYEPIGANWYTVGATALFEVGTRGRGENGTTWVYVKVSSTVKQFDCVTIDENFLAASMTNANAKKSYMVGWAQTAMSGATTSQYGWVALNGTGIQGRVKGVLNHSSKIYSPATSSGSAGVLRASATGRWQLKGVVTVTTSSGSAKSPELDAAWPVVVGS